MLKCLCTRSCSKGMLKTTLLSFKRAEVCLKPSSQQGFHRKTGSWTHSALSHLALTHGLGSHIISKVTNCLNFGVYQRYLHNIIGNQLPKDPTEPPAVVGWSITFVSLAWGLCSQTLLLLLVPVLCPFTGNEWFCMGLILLAQNRNTTLPFHPSAKIL